LESGVKPVQYFVRGSDASVKSRRTPNSDAPSSRRSFPIDLGVNKIVAIPERVEVLHFHFIGVIPEQRSRSFEKRKNPGAKLLRGLHVGAGEEIRTLDIHLGKVALYQLSYSRVLLLLEPYVAVVLAVSRASILDLRSRVLTLENS
jgi:hypothetical protein